MGRKEKVKRSAEEKWGIVQEDPRSGNIAEICRKHGVAGQARHGDAIDVRPVLAHDLPAAEIGQQYDPVEGNRGHLPCGAD